MALIKLVDGLLLRELSYNFPVVPGILPVKTSIIILDKKQQKQQQITTKQHPNKWSDVLHVILFD